MLNSMTAYASCEKVLNDSTLNMELRSVNHRFLDLSIKMPDSLKFMEMDIRTQLKKGLLRGKVDLSINYQYSAGNSQSIHINHELAAQVVKTLHDIDKLIYSPAPTKAIDVLSWPGVIIEPKVDQQQIHDAVSILLEQTLTKLSQARSREGQALEQMIQQRVEQIRDLVSILRTQMPELMSQQKQRLQDKLDVLKVEVDQERLAQEVVYISQKADIAEELDRLDTHLAEVIHTLKESGSIGRRLDFLMQELNREANTLGSKSMANIMTQISVSMKVLIEQMREQVQNIE